MNAYTRKNFLKNVLLGFSAALLAFFFYYLEHLVQPNSITSWIIILLLILCLIGEKTWLDKADRFDQGAEGEDVIRHQLNKLSPRYTVLENLVLNQKHGNIDFILVGPKGIAVVEAKSHSGRFIAINGKLQRIGWPLKTNFIWQVTSQAREIQDFLKKNLGTFYLVNPFIAFSSKYAWMNFGRNPLPGTRVIAVKKEWINHCILEQKGVFLSNSQIQKIVAILRPYQQK